MTLCYKTITVAATGLYKEKGSRFLSYAYPVTELATITEHLQRLRKEHHAARHCCYAYIVGISNEQYRINDDGEPSGTAGKPIFGVLRAQGLTNLLVVVVRYFGGVKLGVSGLIEAYKTATEDALAHTETVVRDVLCRLRLHFVYTQTHSVYKTLKRYQGEILSEEWDGNCQMLVRLQKKCLPQAIAELQTLTQYELLGEE